MEKINLAEFNIDVDSLIRETQNVKQRIDEIRSEMKEMTKENKTSSEAFINNAVSLRELNSEYRNQLKVLGETASAKGKIVPLEQQVDGIMQRQTKTINDLRKQNSDLLKTRNNLNLENAEHVKLLDEINKKYDENTKLIKANVSEREQEQMSVGGYADAMRQVIGETGILGSVTKDMNQVLNVSTTVFKTLSADVVTSARAMSTATTITGKLSGALKLLRAALISTGIGAIVVALGSLAAYLTTAQEGVDRLNRVLTPLRTVLSSIMGVAQNVGEALMNAFRNPRQLVDAFLDGIRPVATILEGIATFNWDKARDGFAQIGQQMADAARATAEFFGEAWERGQQIQSLNERINASEVEMAKSQARLRREINENREIARDMSKTAQERNQAAKLAIDYAKELRDIELNHQDLLIERLKLRQESSANTHQDNLEIARMEAERDEIEANHAQLMIRLNSNLNSSRQKGADNQKKAQDDALKQQSDALDLFIAEQGIRAKTLEQELEDERNIADRKKKILEDELEFKKISQEKYNAEILKINNDLLRRQAEIAENNALRELKAHEDRVQIEREANKWLTDERLAGLEDQEIALRERRAALEALRFSEGLINEQEYADNVLAIHREHEQNLKALRDERKAAKAEERELDYEAEMLALQQRNADQFEIESLMIEQQRERALEAARQKYTDEALLAQAILNIEAEASIAKQQIENAKNQSIFQSRADLAGAIANLVGQETLLGKAAAIAQATMNTYQGATKALASLPPPASYIAAAATIAQGLSSVAKITGISSGAGGFSAPEAPQSPQQILAPVLEAVPPFAGGGKVTGGIPINRSNGDNVLATLKVGEVVLNRSQQRALGGDSTFRAIGVPGFANGGVVSAPVVQSMIRNQVDEVFVEAISRAVRLGAQSGTASGAQKGITDLSTERHIQNLSSF